MKAKFVLNEIKQNLGTTGLGSIGVGSSKIIKATQKWLHDHDVTGYKIVDNSGDKLLVLLKNLEDYIKMMNTGATFLFIDEIEIGLKHAIDKIHIGIISADKDIIKAGLIQYDKNNITVPSRFNDIISDFNKYDYVCLSSRIQFNHDMLMMFDKVKNKLIGIYFKDNYVILRGYSLNYIGIIYPHIIKKINNVSYKKNEYDDILSYILKYRAKLKDFS